MTSIVRSEGVRGLYRGVTPNVLTAGSSWGSYFLFYQVSCLSTGDLRSPSTIPSQTIKSRLQNGNSHQQLATGEHLVAASAAGLMTLIFTNPITVVKTRLCLQEKLPTANVDSKRHYSGMVDAFLKIVKYEGCVGLYKGFIPGLFGVVHGAIQFMAYEDLKNRHNNYYNKVAGQHSRSEILMLLC